MMSRVVTAAERQACAHAKQIEADTGRRMVPFLVHVSCFVETGDGRLMHLTPGWHVLQGEIADRIAWHELCEPKPYDMLAARQAIAERRQEDAARHSEQAMRLQQQAEARQRHADQRREHAAKIEISIEAWNGRANELFPALVSFPMLYRQFDRRKRAVLAMNADRVPVKVIAATLHISYERARQLVLAVKHMMEASPRRRGMRMALVPGVEISRAEADESDYGYQRWTVLDQYREFNE